MRGLARSTLLGWWGLPLGPLVTPVQILRNVVGMFIAPDRQQPSKGLVRQASLQLAQERLTGRRERGGRVDR